MDLFKAISNGLKQSRKEFYFSNFKVYLIFQYSI